MTGFGTKRNCGGAHGILGAEGRPAAPSTWRRQPPVTPPGGGQPPYAVMAHSLGGPIVPAAAASSAQHFFDRRDPAGRGGIISGIPLALGHSDQTVSFCHAAFPSRHADLTAVDLVG